MTEQLFFAALVFAFVTTITPGPNNIMVMTSGANFGFARTRPHIFGITTGFTSLIILVGLGLGGLLSLWPQLETLLRVAAFCFLLHLAWKVANAAPPQDKDTSARPLSFWAAAAFQWVNPKAWAMVLSAHAIYAPGGAIWAVLAVALAFGLVSVPCVSLWAFAGTWLRQFLADVRVRRIFNGVMAALIVLSMLPSLLVL